MSRKRKRRAGLACILLLLVIVLAGGYIRWQTGRGSVSEQWELDTPLPCGEETAQRILSLLEEDVQVLCWQEMKTAVLESSDYNRRATVRALGAVGDTSVLFPGSNYLPAGEQGSCLLGENTAISLFGSTKITGRVVQIEGEPYYVAGIVYREPDICVYQLPISPENNLTHAAVRAEGRAQLDMVRRRLEMILYA